MGSAYTPAPAGTDNGADERVRRIVKEHFSELITDALPVHHEESIQLRGLLDTEAADGWWHWEKKEDKAEFCWKAPFGDGRFPGGCLRASWPPRSSATALPWAPSCCSRCSSPSSSATT